MKPILSCSTAAASQPSAACTVWTAASQPSAAYTVWTAESAKICPYPCPRQLLINVPDQRNSTLYHAVQHISPSYTYQRHRPASVALAPSLTWTPASFPVCRQPVSILSQTVRKFHKSVPLIQSTIPAFAKHQPCNNQLALKVHHFNGCLTGLYKATLTH